MEFKICFIGGGNMASSMVAGVVLDGFDASNITVYDRNDGKLESLKNKYGINVSKDLQKTVKNADMVILSVKPQQMSDVVASIANEITHGSKFVVTVAAGLNVKFYQNRLNSSTAIARVMPNTPSSVQCGASGIYYNENVSAIQRSQAEYVLKTMGVFIAVDIESKIDVVAACAGSSPAYFFKFMEGMIAEAVSMGLTETQARDMVAMTMLGTAKMTINSTDKISTLRENVTSKGGTTAEALRVFNESGLDDIIAKSMQANVRRSQEMSKELA